MSLLTLVVNAVRTARADRFLDRHDWSESSIESLYARQRDPWGVERSPFDQQRFLTVLDCVAPFTPCDAILDAGCGEGMFTRYLTGMARHVAGADVSATAIARARRRVSRAEFHCTPIERLRSADRFDIVVAVGLLECIDDVAACLRTLQSFGHRLVVTYVSAERDRIDPHTGPESGCAWRQFYPFVGCTHHGFTVARFEQWPPVSASAPRRPDRQTVTTPRGVTSLSPQTSGPGPA